MCAGPVQTRTTPERDISEAYPKPSRGPNETGSQFFASEMILKSAWRYWVFLLVQQHVCAR